MTTETRVFTTSETEFDLLIANGRRIFAEEILPKLAEKHNGRYVVVDGRTGDFEIGDQPNRAQIRLRSRQPRAVTFSAGIGMDAASEKWRDWIVSWVRTKCEPRHVSNRYPKNRHRKSQTKRRRSQTHNYRRLKQRNSEPRLH